MENLKKKYLLDIQEGIQHIEIFTATINSFFDYENNLLVKRAVEREIEIIGEAMNRILKLDEDIEIENAKRIVGVRNRVIHGYDKVDDAIIWGILVKHLPILKKQLEILIQGNEEEE